MTRALLVPGRGLDQVRERLTRLGVTDQLVAPQQGCAETLRWFAGNLAGRTLIVDCELMAAEAAIGQLVDDPAVVNGALVSDGASTGPDQTPVRARQRRIVSAGSLGLSAPAPGAPRAASAWSSYADGIPSCWGLPEDALVPPESDATAAKQAAEIEALFDPEAMPAPDPAKPGLVGIHPPPPETAPATDVTGTDSAGDSPGPIGAGVVAGRGQWELAPLHTVSGPNAASLGILVISAGSRVGARDLLRAAADTAAQERWVADPVDLALVALVRGQVAMSSVGVVGPAIRRGSEQDRAAVATQLSQLDEARVLLERANRPDDGFYSTFVLRKLSKPLTALALRLHLTPNQISLFSLFVGLCAALSFAVGTWPMLLVGAVLLQASLTIDCVDGEVARFTRSFSAFGAWLDAATDRVKEYAAYAGLAWGAAAQHGQDLWLLAALVMVTQTLRHIGDYDFSRVQRIRESWVPARPMVELGDGGAGGSGATLALSAQLNERPGVHWFKKVLHMPIGERWLVISLGAVLLGAQWTFYLLLALALLALAYTTLGRIMRARTWHHLPDQSGAWLLEPQLDLGPFGEPLWGAIVGRRRPFAAPFGWAIPALMRLVEFAVVLGAALYLAGWQLTGPAGSDGTDLATGLVFAWLFVVAFHHYDTLYRALGRVSPPEWLVWIGLGWDGRTLLVVLLTIGGVGAFNQLMLWGSLLLGVALVIVASVQWVRQMRGREPVDA